MSYHIILSKENSAESQIMQLSADQPQVLAASQYRSIQIQEAGLGIERLGNDLVVIDALGNMLLTLTDYYGNELPLLALDGSQYVFFNASVESLALETSASSLVASQVGIASANWVPYALGIGALAAVGVAAGGGGGDNSAQGATQSTTQGQPNNPLTPIQPVIPNNPNNPPAPTQPISPNNPNNPLVPNNPPSKPSAPHAPVALAAKTGMMFVGTQENDILGLIVKTNDEKTLIIGGAGEDLEDKVLFVKINSDGSLDTGYGQQGMVMTPFVRNPEPYVGSDVIKTADGKILVVGGEVQVAGSASLSIEGKGFVLARYHADGSVDTSFGHQGSVVMNHIKGSIDSVVQTKDGKYIAAGTDSSATGNNTDMLLVRYHQDGSVDKSFANQGFLRQPVNGYAVDPRIIQSQDGKLVVLLKETGPAVEKNFVLVRYDLEGNLDSAFGTNGMAKISLGKNSHLNSLIQTQEGKFVIAGEFDDGAQKAAVLVCFNSDGSIDKRFGVDGVVKTQLGGDDDVIHHVIQVANGDLIAVGESNDIQGNNDTAIMRYKPDGKLDTQFGNQGRVLIDVAGNHAEDGAVSVYEEADGKLLVTGYVAKDSGDGFVMRLNADGSLDNTFGDKLVVQTQEQEALVLKPTHFAYSDEDSDKLSAIKITDLPDIGKLLFNGAAVRDEQEIAMSDIASGKLSYSAVQTGADKFSYKVIDSGISHKLSSNEAEFLIQII